MLTEPAVYIHGHRLTNAQAMAVRVAHDGRLLGRVMDVPGMVETLLKFEEHLRVDGLGDDEHGRTMVALYTQSSRSVRELVANLNLDF